MLLGTEIGAALTALAPLGIDVIGLNCATGPDQMSEHLRYLSANSPIPISCEPNAGLPQLTADGAYYPLTPAELADAHERFATEFGLSLVGGCCGTTPEHIALLVERLGVTRERPRGLAPATRSPRPEPGVASLYSHVPFRQDTAFLAIGERTNANGSKAFRDALLAGDCDGCVRHRPLADPRRRPPARRLHRLRRPGRRRGHARDRRPARDRGDAAARPRLDRAAGHRGGP